MHIGVEESAMLKPALDKIKALKKEVQLSQHEVAFQRKRMETSDNYQKITTETLEVANKENK